jgi:hypothetical protein
MNTGSRMKYLKVVLYHKLWLPFLVLLLAGFGLTGVLVLEMGILMLSPAALSLVSISKNLAAGEGLTLARRQARTNRNRRLLQKVVEAGMLLLH